MPKTLEEQRADNRARQRKFQSSLSLEQVLAQRERHRQNSQLYYYRKRTKLLNKDATVKEIRECKNKTLNKDTVKQKAERMKDFQKELQVQRHYQTMLFSDNKHARRVAIAWFRVIRGILDPYQHLTSEQPMMPSNWDGAELNQRIPDTWKFHASELLVNFHPEE